MFQGSRWRVEKETRVSDRIKAGDASGTQQQTPENGAAGIDPCPPQDWAAHVAAVKAARGRFAWVQTSSEEFNRRKREEIEREDSPPDRDAV